MEGEKRDGGLDPGRSPFSISSGMEKKREREGGGIGKESESG